MSIMSDYIEDQFTECIEELEKLRLDPKKFKYPYDMCAEKANHMLNDCITIIKKYRGY